MAYYFYQPQNNIQLYFPSLDTFLLEYFSFCQCRREALVFPCYPFRTLEWFLGWYSQSNGLTSISVGVFLAFPTNVVHIYNVPFGKGSHLGLKPTIKYMYIGYLSTYAHICLCYRPLNGKSFYVLKNTHRSFLSCACLITSRCVYELQDKLTACFLQTALHWF